MTCDHLDIYPPRWAESLLRLLLKPEDRDAISGDLLEEYRESIVPARGRSADAWYLRQVGWYVLRATWAWALLVGGALIVRYLFDTLVPVRDYVERSVRMSRFIIAVCAFAAFQTSVRTRSMRAGLFVGVMAGGLGGALSIAGTLVLLAIWHDPATLIEWRRSGGLDEALIFVPIIIALVGLVCGAAGSIAGKTAAAIVSRFYSTANTNSA